MESSTSSAPPATRLGPTSPIPVVSRSSHALRAGKGRGVPPAYGATFPGEIRVLDGAGSGVLLAQQTAANLHAGPGDTVTIALVGRRSAKVKVDGVVDLPAADSLFQKVGAPPGAQLQAPPDNVILLPAARFDAAVRGVPVVTQLHVGLAHNLPAS